MTIIKPISPDDANAKIISLREESLSQNPVIPEGSGTKKSPALKETQTEKAVIIAPIKLFENRA